MTYLSVLDVFLIAFLKESLGDLNLDVFFVEILNVRFDKLKGISHLSDLSNLSIISFIITIEYVLFNSGVEKERLLHNYSDLLSKLSHIVIANVNSINQKLSTSQIIESEEKVCSCRFATARMSNERNFFSSWYFKIHGIEYFLVARGVLEVSIDKLNLSMLNNLFTLFVSCVDLRWLVNDSKNSFCSFLCLIN